MRKSVSALVASCAAICIAGASHAQYDRSDTPSRDRQQPDRSVERDATRQQDQTRAPVDRAQSAGYERLRRLIGCNVEDASGRNLGEIENLAINTEQGEVSFVIISSDGRMVPVPWQAVHISHPSRDSDQVRATLNVDGNLLQSAPTIRRGEMRQLGDESFSARVHQHFRMERRSGGQEPLGYTPAPMPEPREPQRQDRIDRDRLDNAYDRDRDLDRQGRREPIGTQRNEAAAGGYAGGMFTEAREARDSNVERRGLRQSNAAQRDDSAPGGYAGGIFTDHAREARDSNFERQAQRDDNVARSGKAGPGGYAGGVLGQTESATPAREYRVQDTREATRATPRRDQNVETTRVTTTTRAGESRIILASDLLDMNAQTGNRERLGDVEDILITHDGRIAFLVVSSGGMMGMGERLHAVPLQSVALGRINVDQQQIVFNISRDQLRDAPSFRSTEWQMVTTDPNWARETLAFYGGRDDGGALGYVAPPDRDVPRDQPRRGGAQTMNADDVIRNWPQTPQKVAREMMQKYGQPDGVTQNMLIWNNNGPWLQTIVYREEVPHHFPMQHTDCLEQFIAYRMPVDRFDEVASYDGSVVCERTKGVISARCDNENMNYLALNLAHEIATGKRSVEDARQFYAETAMNFKQGQSSPYTEGLRFQAQSTPAETGDKDSPVSAPGAGRPARGERDRDRDADGDSGTDQDRDREDNRGRP